MKSFSRLLLPSLISLLAPVGLQAEIVREPVDYRIGDTGFAGLLVYDSQVESRLPGLLFVPNWMGPTEGAFQKAEKVAAMGYVVFVADMYGVEVRPSNADEAGAAATFVKGDRGLMRERADAAMMQLIEQGNARGILDSGKLGAIGFCFGGTTVLEIARAGRDLQGVVSFHGNLDTPNPAAAGEIRTAVLVLHGADDPLISEEERLTFLAEMTASGADWQFVSFGNTVHSFTNPEANWAGTAEYNAQSAERAFAYMRLFFDELF